MSLEPSQGSTPGEKRLLGSMAAWPESALSALFYYAGAAVGTTLGVYQVLAFTLGCSKKASPGASPANSSGCPSVVDPSSVEASPVKPDDEPAVQVPTITAIPEPSIAVDTHSSVSDLIHGLPLVLEDEQQPLFQTSPGSTSQDPAEELDHLGAESEIKQALQQLSSMHSPATGYLPQSTDAISEGGLSQASSNGGSRTGAARALADGLAIPGSNRRKASTRKAILR